MEDLDITHDTTSFPAVDIADLNAGVAIQITTRNDREKITDTLRIFTDSGLEVSYPRLIIFILGNKKMYDSFTSYGGLDFSEEHDVIDTPQFISELRKLNLEQLQAVDKYFEKYLSLISVNQLYDADILKALTILERDLPALLKIVDDKYAQSRIPNRESDFMDKKNQLNSLSWDEFRSILGHLQHNVKVVSFLSNPINEHALKLYLKLTSSIQGHYVANLQDLGSIDTLMRLLFKAVDTYDDDFDSRKVQIVLHNMYFNCDIGKNPNED